MVEFTGEDLRGSRFDLVNLSGSRFRNVAMNDVKMTGVELVDVEIDGGVWNLRINGVDVRPLIEAELNRRHPGRAKLRRDADADGYREAWTVIEQLWPATVERARRLPPERLHERVDGEWSFIETLRHLVFATDAWIGRALLSRPTPYHPLGLPPSELVHVPGLPVDDDVRPSLDELLALRAERHALVRRVLDDLTDERLAGSTDPITSPGFPREGTQPVRECLWAVLFEEWEHRLYAERDLAVLEAEA